VVEDHAGIAFGQEVDDRPPGLAALHESG
jgi:hypothetical protein